MSIFYRYVIYLSIYSLCLVSKGGVYELFLPCETHKVREGRMGCQREETWKQMRGEWDREHVQNRDFSSVKTGSKIQYKLLLSTSVGIFSLESKWIFQQDILQSHRLHTWGEENWQEYPGLWSLEKQSEKLGIGRAKKKKEKKVEEF